MSDDVEQVVSNGEPQVSLDGVQFVPKEDMDY